jgi:hypothetical protein
MVANKRLTAEVSIRTAFYRIKGLQLFAFVPCLVPATPG